MLITECINPLLMRELSLLGHGDQILIADGNYPLNSETGKAEKIWLGLCPGTPTVTQVLGTLLKTVNVEKAEVMLPEDGSTPEIFSEFHELLGGMELSGLGRFEFYDACCSEKLRVAISTGEKRVFANILLTVGVA